jgi:hypothetical protein
MEATALTMPMLFAKPPTANREEIVAVGGEQGDPEQWDLRIPKR